MATQMYVRVRVDADTTMRSYVVADDRRSEPFAVLDVDEVEIAMYRDDLERVVASLTRVASELAQSAAEWSAMTSGQKAGVSQ